MNRHVALLASAGVLALAPTLACASSLEFSAYGSGIDSAITVTYGSAADPISGGLAATGISGTFSDANISLGPTAITGLQPLRITSPEPGNTDAPAAFSKLTGIANLPSTDHGAISYDNLFYPSGSPQTANSYPPHGGYLDIYGLLFTLSNGDIVNLWSNGSPTGDAPIDYGVFVVANSTLVDNVFSGVSVSPEPGTLCLLGSGALTLAGIARRRLVRRSA